MGPNTMLYVQTSQCQMLQDGQFDTAYHEHVSFFSGHSFQKAAQLSGLTIANFELTPIHGTSCLVTLKKSRMRNVISQTLTQRLNLEKKEGITTDFLNTKYRERALQTRRWIIDKLLGLGSNGFTIGAYGAAAKAMVLLHFLLEDRALNSSMISFDVDDAPLKQNRFCPGTDIPVVSTNGLPQLTANKEKVVFLILAWNFWDEIASNIHRHLRSKFDNVICILPFPTPRLLMLSLQPLHIDTLSLMKFRPSKAPSFPRRRRVLLITHFYNEEFLLPFWIRHHSSMFDRAILINHGSTDRSVEIIKNQAPVSWKVVSGNIAKGFTAQGTDIEVEWYEGLYPNDWKIALTITEFIVSPDLRGRLFSYD